MLAKILNLVRPRPVTEDDYLEALNREIVPVLRAVRDAINAALGEETVESMALPIFSPSAPSTSYGAVNTFVSYSYAFTFQEDDFPGEEDGRTRAIYFTGMLAMDAATSTEVSVALYDVTDGAVVADSEFSVTGITYEGFSLGPLELTDGHIYQVYAKRADGTATPRVADAKIRVRYE